MIKAIRESATPATSIAVGVSVIKRKSSRKIGTASSRENSRYFLKSTGSSAVVFPLCPFTTA